MRAQSVDGHQSDNTSASDGGQSKKKLAIKKVNKDERFKAEPYYELLKRAKTIKGNVLDYKSYVMTLLHKHNQTHKFVTKNMNEVTDVPTFRSTINFAVNDAVIQGCGSASEKKKAEQQAALALLQALDNGNFDIVWEPKKKR